jgi:hypothetical protein
MRTKGGTQIRTGGKGFAGPCLTTWPCRREFYFNAPHHPMPTNKNQATVRFLEWPYYPRSSATCKDYRLNRLTVIFCPESYPSLAFGEL